MRGLLQPPGPSNISINDLEKDGECTLTQSVDDTSWGKLVTTLEGRDQEPTAIQRGQARRAALGRRALTAPLCSLATLSHRGLVCLFAAYGVFDFETLITVFQQFF